LKFQQPIFSAGHLRLIINKNRNLQITVLLILGSLVAAHSCFWLLPGVFETWNCQAVDRLFSFRSSSEQLVPAYDDTIVHVDLTNSTIQRLNNFYLNRSHYAQLSRNLTAMNVSAQLYDFIFAARSNDKEDGALIEATKKAGNVYYGLAFELLRQEEKQLTLPGNPKDIEYLDLTKWHLVVKGDSKGFYIGANPLITFSALASVSKGLGYLSLEFDRDGVFRRMPLIVHYKDAFYPSFSFRAICDYLGVPPEKIVVRPGKSITLKDAKRPGKATAHDIIIPIDRWGNMVINFVGPWERMKHYNFADVLRASDDRDEMEMWEEELNGKIVVVSQVSTGSSDVGPVPTDTQFPLSGLHANVMHTILTESFLREISNREMLFIELLFLLIILVLSLRLSSVPFSLGTIATAASYIGLASVFFFYGQVILHLVRPLLMATFALISILAYRYINEEKQKEVLRRTFEAYFPPLVVKKIMANPKMIASGGYKKELTVLFSDIKNFTGYSSTMTPDHIQELLNEYFEAMTDIVFKYQGTVDKFIGDGLMVFFGDPDPQPDHALRCVRAAVEMQKKVREIKVKWEKRGDMPIQIRIGINTGTVVVGNMGSARRLSYTVLGAAVNMAQRLESNAPVEGIMVSKRTYDLVKEHVSTRPLGQIQVKGFEEFIDVYEVPVEEDS
jgi:adenylate cyclase